MQFKDITINLPDGSKVSSVAAAFSFGELASIYACAHAAMLDVQQNRESYDSPGGRDFVRNTVSVIKKVVAMRDNFAAIVSKASAANKLEI